MLAYRINTGDFVNLEKCELCNFSELRNELWIGAIAVGHISGSSGMFVGGPFSLLSPKHIFPRVELCGEAHSTDDSSKCFVT